MANYLQNIFKKRRLKEIDIITFFSNTRFEGTYCLYLLIRALKDLVNRTVRTRFGRSCIYFYAFTRLHFLFKKGYVFFWEDFRLEIFLPSTNIVKPIYNN